MCEEMAFAILIFCGIVNFLVLAKMTGMKRTEDNDNRALLPMCVIFGSFGLMIVLTLLFF